MKKYLIEFLGTYFLVLAVGISGEALAVGFILSALIYIGALISGAHYNPAISLGAFILKKISGTELVGYVIAHIAGAFIAAVTVLFVSSLPLYIEPPLNSGFYQQLLMETLLTFVLVLLALVAWIGNPSNKSVATYSFVMGFGLLAVTLLGENISGSVFNPALSIGPSILDYFLGGASFKDIPTYTIAPVLGAVLASFAYKHLIQDAD